MNSLDELRSFCPSLGSNDNNTGIFYLFTVIFGRLLRRLAVNETF